MLSRSISLPETIISMLSRKSMRARTVRIAWPPWIRHRMMLDAGEQRGLSCAIETAAGNMHAGGEASSTLAMRTLLERHLRAMAYDGQRGQAVELLRRVLGDERTAIVAAAVLPETEETPKSPDKLCRLCLAMRHAGFRAAGLAVGAGCAASVVGSTFRRARSRCSGSSPACAESSKRSWLTRCFTLPYPPNRSRPSGRGFRPVRGSLSVTVGKMDAAIVAAQRFDGKGSFAPEYPGIFTAKR